MAGKEKKRVIARMSRTGKLGQPVTLFAVNNRGGGGGMYTQHENYRGNLRNGARNHQTTASCCAFNKETETEKSNGKISNRGGQTTRVSFYICAVARETN